MNEIEELFNAMGEAKEEPSEHCKEVVVKKFKRTGMDKALWSDIK